MAYWISIGGSEMHADKDVIQAVAAALVFGQSAGLAAMEGTPQLYPGGGCIVHISDEARILLAKAQATIRGYEPREGFGTFHYELDRLLGGDARGCG